MAEGIRAGATMHDREGIIRAVAWLRPLLEKWTQKLRGYHTIVETAVMPGAKLADIVTRRDIVCARCLPSIGRHNPGYSIRNRDPSE